MTTRYRAMTLMTAAAILLTGACSGGDGTTADAGVAGAAAESPASAGPGGRPSGDHPCDLVSAGDVGEATGVEVVVLDPRSDGVCNFGPAPGADLIAVTVQSSQVTGVSLEDYAAESADFASGLNADGGESGVEEVSGLGTKALRFGLGGGHVLMFEAGGRMFSVSVIGPEDTESTVVALAKKVLAA